MGWLVLSRRTNEDIVIGEGEDAITIRVIETRGDLARIGIDAPRHLRVDRSEVRDRLHREKGAQS